MAAIESPPEPRPLPRWDVTDVFPSLRSRELDRRPRARSAPTLDRLVACTTSTASARPSPTRPSAEEVAALEAVLAATNAVERARRAAAAPTSPASSPPTAATTPPRASCSTLERDAATLRQLARPPGGVGGRPRARGAGRGQPARRRPRLPAAAGRGPGRAPDARARGGALRRAGASPARRRGTGCTATSRRSSPPTSRSPTARRDAADDRGAGAGHRAPTPAVRRAAFDAELAAWPTVRHALRRRPERHQGRGQHRQRPPRLGRPARRVAVRQRRRPRHVRRHAGRRRRLAARLPPLAPGQGPPARPRRRAAVVGPVRPAAGRARRPCRGPTGASGCTASFGRLLARAGGAGRAGPRRALDRRRAARRQAGRRVLHAVHRRPLAGAAQLGRLASTACRRWPTSWATPTTTPSSPTARRMQRQLPMALAETASIFCETLVVAAGLDGRRRRRAPRPARHRPAGRDPGRGRHPQPPPVRDRGVPPPPRAHAGAGRAVRADDRRPAGGLRRRPRPRPRSTRTCGR